MPACVVNGIPTIACFSNVYGNVVRAMIGLAGIVLFVMLLLGGFKYITSGGDPKALESAQKTLTYAVMGLLIIVLSYIILLVIKQVTGVDVTIFNVVLTP